LIKNYTISRILYPAINKGRRKNRVSFHNISILLALTIGPSLIIFHLMKSHFCRDLPPMLRLLPRVLLPVIILISILPLIHCSESTTGPEVSGSPEIDTIILDPDAVHPGADIVMTAVASDPDGDSVTYHWSTYTAAARFSDPDSPVCTLTVSPVLSGGMKLKVNLEVCDPTDTTIREFWIPLIEGNTISGHVFYAHTQIPLQYVEVTVGRLADSSNYKGIYEVHHVPPGTRVVQVNVEGCTGYVDTIAVDSSIDHDIYVECPDMAKTVSGSVATKEDVPLGNVRVTLLNSNGTPTNLNSLTDASGNFSIDFVPAGIRLFLIENDGNLDYDILSDTFDIPIENDTTIELKGRIRRTAYVSDGISSINDWVFASDGFWQSWLVDPDSQSYKYNSCLIDGPGKLAMASPIPIPEDAGGVSWNIDVSLSQGTCVLAYLVDGEVIYMDDIVSGSGDYHIDGVAYTPLNDPAGRNFSVEFYSWELSTQVCSIVHIKHFEIYYYR